MDDLICSKGNDLKVKIAIMDDKSFVPKGMFSYTFPARDTHSVEADGIAH